jgi:nicotinate-nucleotide adenylyltransferase
MKRIGIIGGTFNPPHNGHLLIASEVKTALHLAEVWFMPNNIPPHKQCADMASKQDRINMVELAIEKNPSFKLETIELERNGKSYTIDTIALLKKRYGDSHQYYFIIGADMVEYLPKWHKIEELTKMVTFVGVRRPGFSFDPAYSIIEVDVPEFAVSSSLLRKRFTENKNTMYLIPDKVRNYIEVNRIYGP